MKPTDNIERLMQTVRLTTSKTLDERILTDTAEALARAAHEQTATGRILRIGRLLMQNRYARYATAASIIVAVGFGIASLTVLNNGVSYAFAETVQAMHSVRSLHMTFTREGGDYKNEFWAEFDAAGQVVRCCFDCPKTEDGHKIVYWQDDKARIWVKDKNAFVTIADKTVARKTLDMAYENDPKLLVTRLQEAQAKGEVEIKAEPSTVAGAPIVLTVTYLPASQEPDRRQVLQVDPTTKLVKVIEDYRKVDGQPKPKTRLEILAYNQPIDPAVFQPQLPEGVMRIDQTTQQLGLAQGDMTDEQVAVEVAQQFVQALIDKDYAKAGRLYSGLPAAKIQEMCDRVHFVRIVSVGKPTPHAATRSLRVPITVQIEANGKTDEWTPNGPFVRQVESDHSRWQIIGGI